MGHSGKIMTLAILIAFEYENKETNPASQQNLPGALIDLYLMNHWCQSFTDNVHIITDILANKDLAYFQRNIDYLRRFYAKTMNISLKKLRHFFTQLPRLQQVNTANKIVHALLEILSVNHQEQILIYFSGHCRNDCLILPDSTLLPLGQFRNIIIKNLSFDDQLFVILDCCNPNGLNLPYKLEDNRFQLTDLSKKLVQWVKPKILLISAAAQEEKSLATSHGSVFTACLIRCLITMQNPVLCKESNRNLRRLMGNIRSTISQLYPAHQQTIAIYSSYVMDPVLWMWIGNHRPYDLIMDSTLSIFIFQDKTITT